MQCIKKPINFDLNRIMVEELPWSQGFYREGEIADATFKADVTEYFDYFIKNQAAMPFYTIKQESCAPLELHFERAYAQLVDAVSRLFNESHSTIMEFMGCDFLRKHPYFIDYAKWTFRTHNSSRQSLYGRFDAAFDPVTETVKGIYEFNGDTPTMLFESVNLQTELCKQFTGDEEDQLNMFWHTLIHELEEMGKVPGYVGVLFEKDSFEDMATSETLAQILGQNNTTLFADFSDIDFDHTCREQPWIIGDRRLDVVFALSPWEEIVENVAAKGCDGFKNWGDWCNNVTWLEPAWRWFTANKGIWAYITHLRETVPGYGEEWDDVATLATFTSPERFIQAGQSYVQKPKVGRMSANVKVFGDENELVHEAEGPYTDDCVYQAYCPPGQVEGRNNFIIGMFMVPDAVEDRDDMFDSTAATLCIREFESPTLSWKNERFIPHIIV